MSVCHKWIFSGNGAISRSSRIVLPEGKSFQIGPENNFFKNLSKIACQAPKQLNHHKTKDFDVAF